MKIRKIQFQNHYILGNISLDFCNATGAVQDNIILAGENGVGKSALLNAIYEFSEFTLRANLRDEKRIFEIELTDVEHQFIQSKLDHELSRILIFEFDFNTNQWQQITVTNYTSADKMGRILSHVFYEHFRSVLKSIFSDVAINFTASSIKNITSTDIDVQIDRPQKSTGHLPTEITQLFIDINTLDSADFMNWARENVDKTIDPNMVDIRIKRFNEAFSFIFNKKFKNITNHNQYKRVNFEDENNVVVPLDHLSSGEKQIVFRGSFLLKNKNSITGALILIDEPEISLHPNWQLKILTYYRKLFENSEGMQTSQIIFVTHSPFIIHNMNRSNDKVIILKRDDSGKVVVSDNPEFYSWTPEKQIEEAFSINPFINKTPIVFLEGETDEKYFNTTMRVFNIQADIKFNWIGRIENGKAEFTGDSALNQTRLFLLANNGVIRNKIILLYDSDTNKDEETRDNILIRKMPKNAANELYKKGVENLLVLPENFDNTKFYSERNKVDDYGVPSINRTLDKTKLCDCICDELGSGSQQNILVNIKNYIESILAEL